MANRPAAHGRYAKTPIIIMRTPTKNRTASGMLVAGPLEPVLPKYAKRVTNSPRKSQTTGFWKRTGIRTTCRITVLMRYALALSVDLTRTRRCCRPV